LGPASSVTKNGRVKWFGHVERKDDAKICMTTDIVGGRPSKTGPDCDKEDIKSLGLSQEDAQSRKKKIMLTKIKRLTQVHLGVGNGR